jgi:hypothetical protein
MNMAPAGHNSIRATDYHAEASVISCYTSQTKADLVEEIDRLRKAMTETFLMEHSLTAESVVELSRQLDLKINEYMRHVLIARE